MASLYNILTDTPPSQSSSRSATAILGLRRAPGRGVVRRRHKSDGRAPGRGRAIWGPVRRMHCPSRAITWTYQQAPAAEQEGPAHNPLVNSPSTPRMSHKADGRSKVDRASMRRHSLRRSPPPGPGGRRGRPGSSGDGHAARHADDVRGRLARARREGALAHLVLGLGLAHARRDVVPQRLFGAALSSPPPRHFVRTSDAVSRRHVLPHALEVRVRLRRNLEARRDAFDSVDPRRKGELCGGLRLSTGQPRVISADLAREGEARRRAPPPPRTAAPRAPPPASAHRPQTAPPRSAAAAAARRC